MGINNSISESSTKIPNSMLETLPMRIPGQWLSLEEAEAMEYKKVESV